MAWWSAVLISEEVFQLGQCDLLGTANRASAREALVQYDPWLAKEVRTV
jgi:hypothetical protein